MSGRQRDEASAPAKPAHQQVKGTVLPAVTRTIRRAGCIARCSSGSREAFGSNPWPAARRNLRTLSHAGPRREDGRTGHPRRRVSASPEPCGSKRVRAANAQIPRWDSRTKAFGLIGCKTRQVRLTPARVGSPQDGDIRGRRRTPPRRGVKSARREQLNDERGVKPLRVSAVGDGAGLGTGVRTGKGELLYSIP
jgi:hypothetical protein